MRHIRIFEAYSSALPNNTVLSTEEIKRMSIDEFKSFVEIYLKEKNAEQLFTLFQIFRKYNPMKNNPEVYEFMGSRADEIESLLGYKFTELDEITDVIRREKFDSRRSDKIQQLQADIRNYEYLLKSAKEKLAGLMSGGY